jgi:hypothetical protein
MLFIVGCGGGGSSGSGASSGGGGTGPGPSQFVAATEVVNPLELKKILLDLPNGSSVTQVGGPAVSDFTYTNGILTFIAPGETGKDEVLEFRLKHSDNTTAIYPVKMASLINKVLTSGLEDLPEDGSSPILSDLSITVPSLKNVNVLPASYSDFNIVFSSATSAKISKLYIHFHNGIRAYEITNYFNVDAANGIVSLKTANKTDFQQKLSDNMMEMSIDGNDNKGSEFSFQIVFRYGSNTINGKVVDDLGNTVTSLTGKLVVLNGFNSGARQGAKITSNGTFSFSDVVSDNFSLALVDPAGLAHGSTLFLIQSGGNTVSVNMTVFGPSIPILTPLKIPSFSERSDKDVIVEVNRSIPDFQKNPPIPERTAIMPLLPARPLAPDTDNSISVSGGVKDFVVRKNKTVRVPKGTNNVKVKVNISTAEYPTFTKSASKYNDSWYYDWYCGRDSDSGNGQVNDTHRTKGSLDFDKEIDVSLETKNGDSECVLSAQTVNIGDGALPTTVRLEIASSQGITINNAIHVSGLYMDDNGNRHYNMSLPLETGRPNYGGGHEWTLEVEYKPIDAEITSVKAEILYNTKTYTIYSLAPSSIDKEKGKAQAKIRILEPLLIPAPANDNAYANVLVTLYGTVNGIKEISKPKTMKFPGALHIVDIRPLFEIRNLFGVPEGRRYEDRNDDVGGDGWGRTDMLYWLTSGTGGSLGFLFNDISGEHAWQGANGRSMGIHKTHKGGYDVDIRYWDENGKFETSLRGDESGKFIKTTVGLAYAEWDNVAKGGSSDFANLTKLIRWIKANRSGLDNLAKVGNVKELYVGTPDWFAGPLIRSELWALNDDNFYEIRDVTLPKVPPQDNGAYVLLPAWNKPANVYPVEDHHHHIHVRFKP